MAAEPTDPTTGQPAGLVPAPDEVTEKSWSDQIVANGKAMILDWKETRIAYGTMVGERVANGIPLISDGWSQEQDDKYWLLNDVVATLAKYLGEVDQGVRNVAYDTFGDQIAVLGDPGDFKLDYTNGVLTVTSTNGTSSIDPAGFVGLAPVLIGIIVVVVGTVAVVGIIEISGVIRDRVKQQTVKDLATQEQKIADDIISKGGDPTEAHKTAAQVTKDQLAALTAKAKADAEAGEKSDLAQLAKIVTTVAYVALGVAVVGAAIYFGAPLMQRALASSEPKRLAQQNPSFPQDLRRMSKGQRREFVDHLAGQTLKDLRRRQSLVQAQIEKAYDSQNDRALANLHIQERLLDEAVDRREFGNENPARSTRKFVVHMDNMGDEGTVTLTVQGPGALAWAKDEQTIGGSSWESADGPDLAYTVLYDYPGLVADLKKEGYKLDQTEYTPPDEQQNPAGVNLSSVSVVRLNAGNDTNGNPRRMYVIMAPTGTGIIAAVDEGYYGSGALDHAFGEEIGKELRKKADRGGTLTTTPAEYRFLRKNFGPEEAKFPTKRGDDTVVLHLNAGNDTNGNPRRVYAVFKGGEIVNVIDEGYSGSGALPEDQRNLIVAEIPTTPAERKSLLKQFGG